MDDALANKIASLPETPGVYLMKDQTGEIFYIGKAVNLRARVRSYFESKGAARPFVADLRGMLRDVEVITVGTEKEALILENELIQRYKPRFNIELKDGKNFIYLRIDPRSSYPRLEIVRKVAADGARYFGPYPAARALRETLRLLNRHFRLRTCTDHTHRRWERPCLLCQIASFSQQNVYAIPPEEYRRHVEDAILFLEGKKHDLIESLKARMEQAATALQFERAARYRDCTEAIERTLEPQSLVSLEPAVEPTEALLEGLRRALHLRRMPRRIECFDVSHFHGSETVASCVAATDGEIDKSRYRRYRVKSTQVGDDYASLAEVLERRLRRAAREGDLPDLLLIDGGRAQLAAAEAALSRVGVTDIDVVAIAKPRDLREGNHETRGPERLYVRGRRIPLVLRRDSRALSLLVRLRDEAHRFAITYQRRSMRRTELRSELERPYRASGRRRVASCSVGSARWHGSGARASRSCPAFRGSDLPRRGGCGVRFTSLRKGACGGHRVDEWSSGPASARFEMRRSLRRR